MFKDNIWYIQKSSDTYFTSIRVRDNSQIRSISFTAETIEISLNTIFNLSYSYDIYIVLSSDIDLMYSDACDVSHSISSLASMHQIAVVVMPSLFQFY